MKAAIGQMRNEYAFSERRSDESLRTRRVELAREKPRFGYRGLHVLQSREGMQANHQRLQRIYHAAGLTIRRKKRKHYIRTGQPLLERIAANQEWALDFGAP